MSTPKIVSLVKKLPYLNQVFLERDQLRTQSKKLGFPPGHFHSPIPCVEEIRRKEAQIFDYAQRAIPAVDLNEEQQLALFHRFKRYYKEQPFEPYKKEGIRYFFENGYYPYADAIILYCMLRETRPRRVIEVGSGYSSCLMLDTNQLFLDNAISCTFIEPFRATPKPQGDTSFSATAELLVINLVTQPFHTSVIGAIPGIGTRV